MTNKKVVYLNVVILFVVLYALDFALTFIVKLEDRQLVQYQMMGGIIGVYLYLLGSIFYLKKHTEFNEEKQQLMWMAIPVVVSGLYSLWYITLPLAHYGIYQMVSYSIWIVFAILFAILNIKKKIVTNVRADLFLTIIFAIMFLDDALKGVFSPTLNENIIIVYVVIGLLLALVGYLFLQRVKVSKDTK